MASDWMLQEINSTAKPTARQAAPAMATQPKQIQPAPKAQLPVKKTTQPVHGNFLSGNLLSKTFDILRIPEYAIASFNKGNEEYGQKLRQQTMKEGKTPIQKYGPKVLLEGTMAGIKNIIPGIQKRTQYGREEGDYNAGKYITKNPVGQSAINFTASLGAPSLPIGKIADKGQKILKPVVNIAGKAPVVQKGINLATRIGDDVYRFAKETPAVYKTLEKLPGLEYFRNPEVGKIITKANEETSGRISGLFNTISDVAKGLSKDERIQIGKIIEGEVTDITPKLSTRANYIRQISDRIGKELVDLGVMAPETFEKYKGKYLSHIADVVKNEEMTGKSGGTLKFFLNSLKERKNKLGTEGYPDYIREFQFPVFKSLAGEIGTAESTRAVKSIAGKFGKAAEDFEKTIGGPRMTKEGLVALEDIIPQKIGRLVKDIGVPQEVADYLMKRYGSKESNILEKATNKAMSYWKAGKTIYSGPGYHVRNLLSNMILSDFSTGAGLPSTVYNYGKAVKAYLGKGSAKMVGYLQEMKDAGVINRMDIAGGMEELRPGVFGTEEKALQKIINSPKKLQNAMEETAKLNVYSFWRENGASVQEAIKKAEEAIFSPYRISQTERGLVRNIIPFYSFTRQAAPFVAKTALQHPERITKYEKAKTAIESLSPEGAANNEKLPDYRKRQIRLPAKDKEGNYSYFDPTYIYPYGNFGEEGKGLPLGLSLNPLLMEGAQQAFNKDLYFDQPIAKSNIPSRAKVQRAQHAFQTFAPNILPTDVTGIPTGQSDMPLRTRAGNKIYSAFTNKPDYAGRSRSKMQSILDTFGLKTSTYRPAEQETFDRIDKVKQLESIRKEMQSTLRDKSKTLKEKQEILQQLREIQQEILMTR